jgi:hypothetical protein
MASAASSLLSLNSQPAPAGAPLCVETKWSETSVQAQPQGPCRGYFLGGFTAVNSSVRPDDATLPSRRNRYSCRCLPRLKVYLRRPSLPHEARSSASPCPALSCPAFGRGSSPRTASAQQATHSSGRRSSPDRPRDRLPKCTLFHPWRPRDQYSTIPLLPLVAPGPPTPATPTLPTGGHPAPQ